MGVCSVTTDKCSAYLLELYLRAVITRWRAQLLPSLQSTTKPHERGLFRPKPGADISGGSQEPGTQMSNDFPDTSQTQKSCMEPGWKARLPKLADLSHHLRIIFTFGTQLPPSFGEMPSMGGFLTPQISLGWWVF